MVVGHVIVRGPRLQKLHHALSLRFGHQEHEGMSTATLIMQGLHALSVARHVPKMTSQPRFQRSSRPVRVQVQGKTIKHLARVLVRPHAQPMLTRFARGIRVHDVPSLLTPRRVLGQSVAGHGAVKEGRQRGMMTGQLIQLTRGQNDFFHLSSPFLILARSVVDVVQHGLVAIHFQQTLEFSVDDDGDGRTGIVSKLQHQLQLSAQLGVQHGTVQMPVGRVVKCKQRARPTVSPFLSRHHVAFTLAKTARGFQETVIPAHVQLIAIVRQFQGLIRVFFSFHQLLDTLQMKLLKGKGVLGHVSIEGGRFHKPH